MNDINNIHTLSDKRIIEEIGKKIKFLRLQENLTQTEIALNTGIDRTSISEIENGRPTSLLSLIQILRALDKLDFLAPFFEEHPISPRLLAQLSGKERKRASKKKD